MSNRTVNNLLIADCGGTTVDWCFIDKTGKEHYFATESYHPAYWNNDLEDRAKLFWKENEEMLNAKLYFFSAGCYRHKGRVEATSYLSAIGFNDVTVLSDLHAAGISSYGSSSGWVAVLGTGSVLFKWSGHEVKEVVGGKGHLDGDEGSGYYFGKLILEAARKGLLSKKQLYTLNERLAENNILLDHLKLENKRDVSSISKILSDTSLFNSIHKKNILYFINTYCKELDIKHLSVVGNYGRSNANIVQDLFGQYNIQIREFIDRPITKLVERITVYIE